MIGYSCEFAISQAAAGVFNIIAMLGLNKICTQLIPTLYWHTAILV